jgi:tryptophan halogenase
MPAFLHHTLGLDILTLHEQVHPTFKLGIRFEWGPRERAPFVYPFGDADPVDAMVFDGTLRTQSLTSMLMTDGLAPVVRGPTGEVLSLLPSVKFAYHRDNAPFVRFLASAAEARGIAHIDAKIQAVVPRGDGQGLSRLRTTDGRELEFDLFIDATGFRSLLLEQSLGSPFQSYASSLFCDRAIVATVPQGGEIEPYTTAETMDAGWCWRIPVVGEDHRGYVHSSAFLDEDGAIAEMRRKNPRMSDPWTVRFRSGRHRDFWIGNVVAVGNAYGFVEPLESTALHMVIVEIEYLLDGLESVMRAADVERVAMSASEAVGAHWDYLRWFLAVHYKFNRRVDSPFWQAARNSVDITGVDAILDEFRTRGPSAAPYGQHVKIADPVFWFSGLLNILLGQGVELPLERRTTYAEGAWRERVAKNASVAKRALKQGEALQVLRAHPEMLERFVDSPNSWCRSDAERVLSRRKGSA